MGSSNVVYVGKIQDLYNFALYLVLYKGGFNDLVTEDNLRNAFMTFGNIVEISIVKNNSTGTYL